MYRVKDGEIIERALPRTGVLSDGRSVSGYHLLPEAILQAEGWLPVEEVKPKYDPKTQQLSGPAEQILKDKIVLTWQVEPLPTPEPAEQSETDKLRAEVDAVKAILVVKQVITEQEKADLIKPIAEVTK
jgi:hypothetical protein